MTIFPMYKKGDQSRPENYRPLCLLSHTRKIIYSAVLIGVNRSYTPTRSQFGFQTVMSVQQALLAADYNARMGIAHMAVLELYNAYDRVDRRKLLHLATKWLSNTLLNIVRYFLGPLTICVKGEPTNTQVRITRGIPQGAPSSPVLFNMYIDELGDESSECVGTGDEEGAVIRIADGVLLQTTTYSHL